VTGRTLRILAAAAAGFVLLFAIVIPSVAIAARSVTAGAAPSGGWVLASRQWWLLGNTIALAAASVGIAIVLALPVAYLVAGVRGASRSRVIAAMLMPLLLPPMVYAFGWQRVIKLPPTVQCIGVWSSWAWPIPALIVGAGWARFGRAAYEAALLSVSAGTAFVRVALPCLFRYVTIAALILFVLFMGEYSVPHACGLTVYATDLLGIAESHGPAAIEVLWPSLPLIALLGASACGAWVLWRRSAANTETLPGTASPARISPAALIVVAVLLGLTVGVPLGTLFWHRSLFTWMAEAWRTYHTELLQSLGVAAAAGVIAVLMGAGLALWRAGRRIGTAWALACGVLPGALIGQALIAAYLDVSWVYNHWPIVVACYIARFGWIGMLAGYLAMANVWSELVDQARTDGADAFTIDTQIRLWPNLPVLAAGGLIVAALSLADLTAIALVRIPSIGTISLTLVEKMHRFEGKMLVSLSLWLVLAAVPAAGALAIALRRQ
jgi:ABC-type Fe3+ transport system permease subunit